MASSSQEESGAIFQSTYSDLMAADNPLLFSVKHASYLFPTFISPSNFLINIDNVVATASFECPVALPPADCHSDSSKQKLLSWLQDSTGGFEDVGSEPAVQVRFASQSH